MKAHVLGAGSKSGDKVSCLQQRVKGQVVIRVIEAREHYDPVGALPECDLG